MDRSFNKVYTAKTKNNGKGIFAKTDIEKNETIFIVKGKLTKHSYGPRYNIGPRWLGIGKNTWMMPLRNNAWCFINHSCEPNSGLRGKVTIVAMKNIKKNEEITIDYSTTEEDPYWKMKCKCGSKNCRKIIRSIKYLPMRDFKKYKLFIPKYFKKSYEKTHLKQTGYSRLFL